MIHSHVPIFYVFRPVNDVPQASTLPHTHASLAKQQEDSHLSLVQITVFRSTWKRKGIVLHMKTSGQPVVTLFRVSPIRYSHKISYSHKIYKRCQSGWCEANYKRRNAPPILSLSEGSGQWICVQVEAGHKWHPCPPGVSLGISTL